MILSTNCLVGEHYHEPDPECQDCKDRFCRECGVQLTSANSALGADTCNAEEK
jgi:hypothetical protein